MLKGKDLILETRKYAKEDRKKSVWLTLSSVLLAGLFYAGGLWNLHWSLQLISSTIAGLLIVRVFIIYHDYLHKAILQHSKPAEWFFTFFGLFILAPTSIWKRSHDYHHTHNSKLYTTSIGSFPVVTKKDFLKASKGERRLYLFIRHPITICLGYLSAFLWGFCIRTLIVSPKKHLDCLMSIIVHYGVGAIIYYVFGWQTFLIGFLWPAFLSSGMGTYLFYAQHNFPSVKFNSKEEWSYFEAALYSSSFMKMSGLMNWFTGNIGYHHIHHINSKIPFYRLPEVYNEMQDLHISHNTSLSLKDVWACFKLKVWDSEQGKMIGMRELRA